MPSCRDLPDPGIQCLLHWQVGSLPLVPPKQVLVPAQPQLHDVKLIKKMGTNLILLYITDQYIIRAINHDQIGFTPRIKHRF